MNYEGEKFLLKLYKDMHLKQSVIHSSDVNDKKLDKIKKYLDRQESVHQKALEHGKLDLLKKAYFDKYVIKEIPKEYMDFLDKTTFDQTGHHLTDSLKEEHKRVIIEDQRKSLSSWIDYLTSEDARFYPWWAKYWAFQGMLKIGAYDNENNIYGKRDETTVAPFIELNQEALAKAIDLVIKEVSGEEIDEDLKQLISSGSFTKLYTIFSKENRKELYDNEEIDGIWIKYEQGDNYKPLLESLQGYNTGWCTAGEATCKSQIENGDFYVYYTKDKNNEYKVPRLAIRMDGKERIGEIRGVAKGQNVESHLEDILDKKLDEFSDKEKYKQRLNDSKMITYIYTKFEHNKELTTEDLKFIYEIDREIERFGYETDPRITKIKKSRNRRKDLSLIFDCKEDEIATTRKELKNGDYIKVFDGDLYYGNITNAKDMKFPEIVLGDLSLVSLTSAEGIIFPKKVTTLNLESLQTAEGVTFPEKVEEIHLDSLTSAKRLTFPEKVKGLHLDSLTSAEGLILPKEAEWLHLDSLTSAEGLILPKEVEWLHLDSLTSAKGLTFPEKVKGLYLNSLTSAEGVTFPEQVGVLDLSGLISAEGLILPEKVKSLGLSNLTSAKGVTFPKEVEYLHLESLKTAEGLILPKEVKNLYLRSLKTAEGLVLPKKMFALNLSGLESAEGLIIPETIIFLDVPYNVSKELEERKKSRK